MTQYTVELTDEAWAAIEAQIRFIAVDRQAPENAARWSRRLLQAIDDLELLPHRYPVNEPQTAEHGVEIRRMVFEKTYLIFYTIDEAQHRVVVVSLRHGARLE
jgi:plasmid stabilization system protein ParE